jgi:hypothetical protein
MHGFNGLWKWLATPHSTTAEMAEAPLESKVDEARFSGQLGRLYQSIEKANAGAKWNSRGKPQMARAAGESVRPM